MRRFLHPFLGLILSLLLVSGQQAALAHMLAHATTTGTVEAVQEGDADHGAALSLSHTCTTCIAFAGVDAAPASSIPPLALSAGRITVPAIAVPPAPTFRFSAVFRSRAPPPL